MAGACAHDPINEFKYRAIALTENCQCNHVFHNNRIVSDEAADRPEEAQLVRDVEVGVAKARRMAQGGNGI
jgi:hypothetical protein